MLWLLQKVPGAGGGTGVRATPSKTLLHNLVSLSVACPVFGEREKVVWSYILCRVFRVLGLLVKYLEMDSAASQNILK